MQNEPGHWQAVRGSAQRQPGTGGVPVQGCATASGLDDCSEIVELPFQRVRWSVAAGAPATPIDVEHRGEAAERHGKRTGPAAVAEDATDNDARWPLSDPVERDGLYRPQTLRRTQKLRGTWAMRGS